ncbi:methyltransferase domain-containing protein [Deinococcus metallilatus]|uniref:Protein-L-isoaspartate O-methyltransferase n=1 Tax=Deinococcus metallilatus TaxID=1211322 RepID=A0AAJ5K4E3_9DEIO|nr:methyltransferase domain-containing protein [Deinococcus metallilatus]MBB5296416.1 methyltransferase of FxLD system [Deinococcus metallilatus]QBY09912.1 methyltransferase domain-containing protein [Deinococcus metallilatus]RXJ08636.1 methyltransferase domain-containing protein [Deinococcus metallilatus]TLK25110.1 methyltransferase domain-containing protein [Deinococcus metallilatus]GMA14671.1 hypothetical protein GCM10025871_10020 [Deinococcus metallilatus]
MPSQDQAAALRKALVAGLVERGVVHSANVEAALRAVPRHLFTPWLSPEEAYADQAWLLPETTPDAPATISQPTVVGLMLEACRLAPGQRVLEIGAGSGYNAALMAHLVGEHGQVVTVDIEAPLVEAARGRLAEYRNVQVVHGDGGHGFPAGAPYDRIVATVGAWDLPPAWREQLAPDGQLILPLHLGGEPQDHELIAFRREGHLLVGHGICSVQMVLMRGDYAGHGRPVPIQKGQDWQGTTADNLLVKVYPHGANHQPQPHEVIIDKPSARLVLAHRQAG